MAIMSAAAASRPPATPGRTIPPHLLQALVESAGAASVAVGPAAVLAVLDRLADLALSDVRAVSVEARQLASGDVQLTARPETSR